MRSVIFRIYLLPLGINSNVIWCMELIESKQYLHTLNLEYNWIKLQIYQNNAYLRLDHVSRFMLQT